MFWRKCKKAVITTGVKLLDILARTHYKMSDLANMMTSYPQVLENIVIPARSKGMWNKVSEINEIIEFCKGKLGDDGRILVRESGTEPLVRVMLEGKNFGLITDYAHRISDKIRECLCTEDSDAVQE